jgi:hypothetical protein
VRSGLMAWMTVVAGSMLTLVDDGLRLLRVGLAHHDVQLCSTILSVSSVCVCAGLGL